MDIASQGKQFFIRNKLHPFGIRIVGRLFKVNRMGHWNLKNEMFLLLVHTDDTFEDGIWILAKRLRYANSIDNVFVVFIGRIGDVIEIKFP